MLANHKGKRAFVIIDTTTGFVVTRFNPSKFHRFGREHTAAKRAVLLAIFATFNTERAEKTTPGVGTYVVALESSLGITACGCGCNNETPLIVQLGH